MGLPLGNVTSQLFANIYLNELDQFIKNGLHIKFFVRYCDDFVTVVDDLGLLSEAVDKIDLFLSGELNLKLHPQKIMIRKYYQGIDFLGYILRPHHRTVRRKTEQRILKRVKPNNFQSYLGVLRHCSGYNIKMEIEKLLSKE